MANENFVAIDRETYKWKLSYYVEADKDRETIARKGYETVMKYHTVEVRLGS